MPLFLKPRFLIKYSSNDRFLRHLPAEYVERAGLPRPLSIGTLFVTVTGPKLVLIYVLLIGRRPVLNLPVVAKVCSIVAFCGFSSPEKDFGRGVA